jgi:hypothetical protein
MHILGRGGKGEVDFETFQSVTGQITILMNAIIVKKKHRCDPGAIKCGRYISQSESR